jgi:hypothetical protein
VVCIACGTLFFTLAQLFLLTGWLAMCICVFVHCVHCCRQRQAAERAERERKEAREAEEAEKRRKLNPKEAGFRCAMGV